MSRALDLIQFGFLDIRRTVAPLDRVDHDCVDGLPLDFSDRLAVREQWKFDDAFEDDLVPPHELARHEQELADAA